jgi:transcriptional regulator with XRE-family HTH domain
MYPNLKLQLWKMGVRQNRLAKALGMDETVLSKILNGYRLPTEETRNRIGALLQTDPEWLFGSETNTVTELAVNKVLDHRNGGKRMHGPRR